jgi:hypothetical protein
MIDVKTYGAKGNGITDDAAEIQAAAKQAIAACDTLYFPAGTYIVKSPVGINGPLDVVGASEYVTTIWLQGAAMFYICSEAPVHFEKLTIGNQTNNSSIVIDAPPGHVNHGSTFDRVVVNYAACGIDFLRADTWSIQRCKFNQHHGIGVRIRNLENADDGDSAISDTTFASAITSCTHIQHESAGGIRIINCKMNGGGLGYNLSLAPSAQTGDIIFAGNSIENQAISGFAMSNQGAGVFGEVAISGNQFANIFIPIYFATNTGQNWIRDVAINGNVLTSLIANVAALIDIAGVDNCVISGNVMRILTGKPCIISSPSNTGVVIVGNTNE